MQTKTNINLEWGHFWLNLGWYRKEPLKLFGLVIGEICENYKGRVDLVAILSIQILRFLFAFGWQP
jgi:hypothetical protein